MRKITLDEINETINLNKIDVNEKLFKERQSFSKEKTKRTRDEDEIATLTEVAKASVERAKKEGKFVVTGERKLYYDPS